MACARMGVLGQFEARYSRMMRVIRVTTGATLSNLTHKPTYLRRA